MRCVSLDPLNIYSLVRFVVRRTHLSSGKSRREFLKLSAFGVAAVSTGEMAGALSGSTSGSTAPSSGDISIRVTSGQQRYTAEPSMAWNTGTANENVIE